MERPEPRLDTEGDVIVRRIAALLVDVVLVGLASAVFVGVLGAVAESLAALGALVALVVNFGYFIYLEAEYGQTLGKKLLDIVVVKEDGAACDMRASAVRNLLRIVDGQFTYLVGLLLVVFTDRNQRLGDIVGDTVVVEAEA